MHSKESHIHKMNNTIRRISSLELDGLLTQVPEYKAMFKNASEYHALMRVVAATANDAAVAAKPRRPNPPPPPSHHVEDNMRMLLYDDELFDLDCQAAAAVATTQGRGNKGLA